MSSDKPFSQATLDSYLRELAKELRRIGGNTTQVEIILIGGASIVANYDFRDMTRDMDAIIPKLSLIKEAINRVGDRCGLPRGWLNADFVRTKSYTPKLVEVSVYYKTFFNVLTVRTIVAEYLVAMKLMAGRQYKNDLSDIIGIISEHNERGRPITYEQIDRAVCLLYGSWDNIQPELRVFIVSVLEQQDYSALYMRFRDAERLSRDVLLVFTQQHPNIIMTDDNITSILEKAKRKRHAGEEPDR